MDPTIGPHATPARAWRVGFREAFLFWLRLGFINFGGPTGQIALMHQELVERRGWIDNGRFLHALNYCMLLPGPEAQQLAIYVGWLLHRTAGGMAAGVLFILPAFFLILVLSWVYAMHGDVAWIAALFYGLRAAVIAIVAAAVLRIGSQALRKPGAALLAASAFVAIFFGKAPFPAIVATAGLLGLIAARLWPGSWGRAPASQVPMPAAGGAAIGHDPAQPRPSLRRAALVTTVGLAAWWLPLLAVRLARGPNDVLWQEALFFSKAAMVTFGGAYAVLAYINQMAVEHYRWLAPGQMLDGLGLAESTPGPLIMVTEFVGFMGAFQNPGGLHPLTAGVLGAAVTVWATFAPCFLWIFLGAPFVEHLRSNVSLNAALSAITAAVVGVILNLAVWLALHTLFGAVGERRVLGLVVPVVRVADLDAFSLSLAVCVFLGMWRYGWGIVPVVLGSAAAGLLYRWAW